MVPVVECLVGSLFVGDADGGVVGRMSSVWVEFWDASEDGMSLLSSMVSISSFWSIIVAVGGGVSSIGVFESSPLLLSMGSSLFSSIIVSVGAGSGSGSEFVVGSRVS